MSEIYFRIAQQADLEIIVAIYNSTIPSRLVTADTEPVSVESRQAWFEKHIPEKYPLWVIENDAHEIIGWAGFQPFHSRPAYAGTVEVSIYLSENIRGLGIGKQVLQFCLQQAPQLNYHTVLGYIFSHNEPSLKLFKKFEFEVWADMPNVAILDNVERGLTIMGKRVRSSV